MIDPTKEHLLTPAQAGRFFPSTVDGKRMGPQSIIRLGKKPKPTADGGRVVLEMINFGGRLFTSAEAIHRYIAALSAQPDGQDAPEIRTPTARRKAAETARAELQRAGF